MRLKDRWRILATELQARWDKMLDAVSSDKTSFATFRQVSTHVALVWVIPSAAVVWLWPRTFLGLAVLTTRAVGPPLFFLIEHRAGEKLAPGNMNDLKSGQELARNFWAGVGALLLALYAMGDGKP